MVDLFPVRFTCFSAIFNRFGLDKSLVELWSKYRLQRSALAFAQRKGSAKV